MPGKTGQSTASMLEVAQMHGNVYRLGRAGSADDAQSDSSKMVSNQAESKLVHFCRGTSRRKLLSATQHLAPAT
ncbi:MAG: hypothetical protein ACJ74Z_01405 [Bryobacteraceae bacterium]